MTVALIDADIVVYKAASVSQTKPIDWGDGEEPASIVNDRRAADVALKSVEEWKKLAKAKHVTLAFTDRTREKSSFRYSLYKDYKANRTAEKPTLHNFVADRLKEEFPSVVIPGLEGDDVLGIMATSGEIDAVVVSTDKDAWSIPSRVLFPNKGRTIHKVSTLVADKNWMLQTLIGDATDGYKGAPGVGPVTARQLLASAGSLHEMWSIVEKAYREAKANAKKTPALIRTEAITQARLARILRTGDYNKDTGEVKLWHPQTPVWVNPSASRN